MIEIGFDASRLDGALDRVGAMLRSPRPLLAAAGDSAEATTRLRFERGGPGWAPLSGLTLANRSGSSPLVASGGLRDSIGQSIGSNEVELRSSHRWAEVHQRGKTIEPKSRVGRGAGGRFVRIVGTYLKVPAGGGRFVNLRRVVIPARPFLFADEELAQGAGDAVVDVLKGAWM